MAAPTFNPEFAYFTVTDIDGNVYAVQNGIFYDKKGNVFVGGLPGSANGYAPAGLPVVPPSTRRIAGMGSILPFLPTGNGTSQNYTFGHAVSAFGAYNAVQLVFLNASASTAVVDNYCVAAGNSLYPNGANNIALPSGGWGAAQGSITIPGATGGVAKTPGVFVTPAIPLQSIPRAAGELDGGIFPLLFVRCFVNTGNTNASYAQLPNNWPTLYNSGSDLGLSLQTAVNAANNSVTTPGSWVAATNAALPNLLFAGAIFSYDRLTTSVCAISDSTLAGTGDGITTIQGPLLFAVMSLINGGTGKALSHYTAGGNGVTMAQMVVNAAMAIANLAPDIMVIQSWSVNSPYTTQAQWDTQWNQCMQIAQAQSNAGKRVIIMTPWPNSGVSGNGTYASQQLQRQRVLNSGYAFVDMNPLIGANGNWNNLAYTTDQTHGTLLGDQVIGKMIQAVLDPMIN